MNFTVVSVGRLKEAYWVAAVNEYVKRIGVFGKIRLVDVKDDESLPAAIPQGWLVFALCIEGERLSSEGFSERLERAYLSGKKGICFVIGGAEGLPRQIKEECDCALSLSDMTFPHRLAKIMLLEQLYRALSIQNNRKYHR